MLHCEHAARAAEAGLHLVRDEHDPLPVADPAQPLDELGRGRHEPALAELRLEDDRGNLGGRHLGREHALDAVEGLSCGDAAVLVRELRPVDLRGERPHAGLVRVHLRRHRHGEHRAAVEPRLEGHDGLAPRGEARDLDGVLDGLGARVEERGPGGAAQGREVPEPLGELDVHAVGDDREVRVDEARRLLLNRLDHAWVAVADVAHADAAREVDERVAVHVGDGRVERLGGEDREVDLERLRKRPPAPLEQLLGAGPGDPGADVYRPRRCHEGSVPEPRDRLPRRIPAPQPSRRVPAGASAAFV